MHQRIVRVTPAGSEKADAYSMRVLRNACFVSFIRKTVHTMMNLNRGNGSLYMWKTSPIMLRGKRDLEQGHDSKLIPPMKIPSC